MAFRVREAMLAQVRDGALVTQGCQHSLQRPALGDVVVDVVRRHDRHLARETEHPGELAFVVGAAMQLDNGVNAIAEEFLVAGERSAAASSSDSAAAAAAPRCRRAGRRSGRRHCRT